MIGAIFVWGYLTELPFIDRKAFMMGDSKATVPASTPETRKKFGRQILLSQIGLGLIVLGSVIQIISNYLPDC